MIHGCHEFRALLEASLAGRPAGERLSELAWHQHLFGCADCRELLAAEEALEALLASLPEPRLAPEVSARVVARLQSERALDALLEIDAAPVPAQLAARVRARALDARLDRLLALDLATPPAGLAQRTKTAVALARRARPAAVRWLVPLAAAAAIALVAWAVWPDRETPVAPKIVEGPGTPEPVVPPREPIDAVANAAEPDPELLAALDVLENWDLLMNQETELLLASLPTGYEAVIDDLEEDG